MEKLLTKRNSKYKGEGSPKRQRPIPHRPIPHPIPHRPSIASVVEDPCPPATFNTTILRRMRDRAKSNPLLTQSIEEERSRLRLASYSNSYTDSPIPSKQTNLTKETVPQDQILSYITRQRSRLGIPTVPTKCPDKSEGDSFRESLVATSAPMTGIKDLQQYSRKLSHHQSGSRSKRDSEERTATANEFVYALRQDESIGVNPYDLYIVPAQKARLKSRYYTISAFGILEIDKKGQIEPVHVLRWLWERDMLIRLLAIPFFKKFKLWRLFVGWKRWIYEHKIATSKQELEIGLFSADVFFQKALLQIQDICMAASGTTKNSSTANQGVLSLVSLDMDKTYSLSEFMSLQADKCHEAGKGLFLLREKVIDVVTTALKVVGEKEKMFQVNKFGIAMEPEDEPSHTQVLEWRKVRAKLRRFEQACSNLILGLLQRLVMKAIHTLELGVRRALKEAAAHSLKQREGFLAMREEITRQPYTQAVLDRLQFTSDEYFTDEVGLLELQAGSFSKFLSNVDLDCFSSSDLLDDSCLSGVGTSVSVDNNSGDIIEQLFNKTIDSIKPIWNVQLQLPPLVEKNGNPTHAAAEESGNSTPQAGNSDLEIANSTLQAGNSALWADNSVLWGDNSALWGDNPAPLFEEAKSVPLRESSSHQMKETDLQAMNTGAMVLFTPTIREFQDAFNSLLKQYETVVSDFVPMSEDCRVKSFLKHSKYDLLMLLEAQDKPKHTRHPELEKWPNVMSLLHQYGPYNQCVVYIEKTISFTMNAVQKSTAHFQSYGEMIKRCKGVSIEASLKSTNWNVSMFQRAFALYHDQVHAIESMVNSFLVGVVNVEASAFKEFCLAFPTRILKELEYEFPKLVAKKAEQLVTDIKDRTDRMLIFPSEMSLFIQLLADVSEVEASIPHLESRLTTITNLYNVAQQFEVYVCEEEMALYKSLFTRFRQLKNALMQAQATKSESVHDFSAKIRSKMVEILHRAMELKVKSESLFQLEENELPSSIKPLERISELKSELDVLTEHSKKYVQHHHLFAEIPTSKRHYSTFDPSSQSWTPEEVYDEVLGVQEYLNTKQTLYKTKERWDAKIAEWCSVTMLSLNIVEVKKEVNSFVKTMDQLEKNIPASHKLLQLLHSDVLQFACWLPTLTCLLNPALKYRHWDSIQEQTNGKLNFKRDPNFNIKDLKEIEIFDYHTSIAFISNQANHEETLENMLKKISKEWSSKEFELVPYKGLSDRMTHILNGAEEIFASLEDGLTVLNIIKSSRYVGPIRHSVLDWNSRLALALETVEYWVLCQKNWLYLENVFSAVDIQRQLTTEVKSFLQADKYWREVVHLITEKPTALKAVTTPGVLEAFRACNILLEQVFKSLEDYLEAKRLIFPRLNFISNSELLDILSHSKNLNSVQPYLSKLFGNIKRLEFSEDRVSPPVIAMVSAEDEKIKITRKCFARGSPENWLVNFEETMKKTVKDLLKDGVATYNKESRHQWVLSNPGQVVLTVCQINWTMEVEFCLKKWSPHTHLSDHHHSCITNLASTATLLKNEALLPSKRCVISSLLTLDLHGRDVTSALITNKVTSNRDFEWTRHLCYYWDKNSDTCFLRQSCASFQYINEYLGCLPRLVITPLSERCYLTLTTAMHLHLGGSPIGPAGTGKSETVKDLAKALGQLCLIINCSEGLDYKMMGRYFSGLCQSGIWCCFDEFNRIDVEVLSVVAQQLQCVKTAKDSHATSFIFERRDVKLVTSCSVFITMNPSYTGRVELPDNLKSYFRPVAMMVPDTNMIAEVSLFVNGFTTASTLALKLSRFYEMIQSQISQQNHYYFGLRSVKAVISLAGDYLKSIVSSNKDDKAGLEKQALLLAIQNTTLPRLLANDVPAVRIILWDLFHLSNPESKDAMMTMYIEGALAQNSMKHSSSQIQKCLELYKTLLVRHGVMLLGPTGGGKTSIIRILTEALNKCYTDYYGPKLSFSSTEPSSVMIMGLGSLSQVFSSKAKHCQLDVINPKAISVGELYGYSDKFTLEWKNGILARVLLSFFVQTENELNSCQQKPKDTREQLSESSRAELDQPASPSYVGVSSLPKLPDHSLSASSCVLTYSCPFGMPYPPCAPAGWRFVTLDGPVDSEWIENLNSVLDDSKVLCLSNGERIRLMPGSRVLFESDDLANASPATVSRCAVIFLDPIDLGWKPLVLSWLKTLPDDLPDLAISYIQQLFDVSVDAGLAFLKRHSSELSCPVPGISAVKSLCCILDGLLRSIIEYHGGFVRKEEQLEATRTPTQSEGESTGQLPQQTLAGIYIPKKHASPEVVSKSKMEKLVDSNLPLYLQRPSGICDLLGSLFVFAFTWAFGGCFERIDQEVDLDITGNDISTDLPSEKIARGGDTAMEKFDALVYNLFSDGKVTVQLPTSTRLIYAYYPNIYTNSFEPLDKLISSPLHNVNFLSPSIESPLASQRHVFKLFVNPSEETYSASTVSMIPTVDIVRISFLISVMLESGSMPNIMVSGKSGVGKTQLLAFLSKSLSSKKWRKSVIQSILGKPHHEGKEEDREKETADDQSFSTVLYHISTRLKSQQMQAMLGSFLMRQGKSILIPPTGRNLIACFDDLHAASCDDYGTKPSLELLRQLIDGGGWYTRKMLQWKDVVGVNFLATQAAHGATVSRRDSHSITERLLSKFCLLDLPEATSRSLFNIYSTHILKSFTANIYSREVLNCTAKLTACSIYVLHACRAVLTPSPMNPQYTFCLKDLSKVFSGFLRLNYRSLSNEEEVVQLVVNEQARVFYDRCFPKDREKVLTIISEGIRRHFKVLHTSVKLKEQLLELPYSNFMDSMKGYTPVKNTKKLVKYFEKMQNQLNISEDKNSHLLFFPLACEHIIRMIRILQMPNGHILLIGLGGVGRRSCIQLAAYVANIKYHCLTPIHSQTPFADCLEEIKSVLRQCGLLNQPTVLLATDNPAGEHHDSFFSVLNELVVNGEVLLLFEKDEMEIILSQLTEDLTMKATELKNLSSEDLKQVFIKRIFQNLHVVLCFAPLSPELAKVCRQYPGLVMHATVDVFDEWPARALYGVAVKKMQTNKIVHSVSGALLKPVYTEVASVCVKVHVAVLAAIKKSIDLSFVVTPSSFIDFIMTFTKQLVQQYDKLNTKRIHFELGISRLTGADEKVLQMESELQLLQPQVLEKAEEVEVLLQQLADEQKEVDTLRISVFQERMDIAKETERVTSLAREAEQDLQSVLPELKAAEKGLNALKKSDLTEIRSYGTPPTMVMNVMSAVCVLLKEPTEWSSIRHIMVDPVAFLKRLTSLDKNSVSDKLLAKLKKYTRDPNFSADKMVHYSFACQSFCQWVLAIESYCMVYRVVQPKRELHWKISAELDVLVGRLQAKEMQLNELKARMAVLTDQCAVKKQEKHNLQEKIKEIKYKLSRTEFLIKSLQYEQVRWKETLSDLESKTSTVIGDSLLLSSCITYLGPFTPVLRKALLSKWKHLCRDNNIACDAQFSLEGTLSDSETVQEWYVQGLPKDNQSIQNAVLLTTTEKCPFIIDPQAQASKWLKAMLANSQLMVQEYASSKLIQFLEHAARAGLPLLLTGVPEQLSSVLDPFLQTNPSDNSGSKNFIKVGKMEIECSPSFRLFLISSKVSAELPSDTCTRTTIINFSATLEGYQDQLLSATIHIEEPTLESQYNNLLLSISYDSKQLEKMEQKLLECLSTSTGHLLEDDELVKTLKYATHTAAEVKQRLQKAFETRESILNSRLKYERVAQRGSILFFTILSLQNLNPVYIFSSDWFMEVFRNCVQSIQSPTSYEGADSAHDSAKSGSAADLFETYVDKIVNHVTLTIFHRVSYGILAGHCLPFAFKLCAMLLMHNDGSLKSLTTIRRSEWMALLRDNVTPDGELAVDSQFSTRLTDSALLFKKLKPDLISHEAWEEATQLEKALLCFNGLLAHIIHNVDLWVQFSKAENPWSMKFDGEEVVYEGSITKSKRRTSINKPFTLANTNRFQLLVLINIFCPSRLATSAKWFIETEMSTEYTTRMPPDLKTIYQLTSNVNPALIIVAPNVDPTGQLKQLAEDNTQFLDTISLGQGQGEKAKRNIWMAAKRGRWVFLQNCHLALSWMPQLGTLIKELQASPDIDGNFRLWLSSKSTTVLPFPVLQSSIKVCLESPTSVKSNMHQVLSSRGAATISRIDYDYGDIIQWQQLVFRLCLFHSMANSRRAYGSEGWRVPYIFGPTDLKVSIQLLQNVFKDQIVRDDIPWPAVHHLVGEICYGGKVTDAQDMRTLKALLVKNCSPQSITEGYGDVKPGAISPGINYSVLTKLIEVLPDEDTPSALGLSPVLQSTLIENESRALHSTLCLLETSARSKGYEERIRDEDVLERAEEFLETLPSGIKPFTLSVQPASRKSSFSFTGTSAPNKASHQWSTLSPFWAILANEVVALNEKILLLNTSLKDVVREIKGEVVKDQLFPLVYKGLAENMAPDSWKFGRDSPPALPDWMEWFMKLHRFYEKWFALNTSKIASANFSSPPKLPNIIWLSAFSYPNGFFEAIKQNHSRKMSVPVEEVSIKFDDMTHLGKELKTDAVIISGLRVGLANWDLQQGLMPTTSTQTNQYSPMPDMVCYPVHKAKQEKEEGNWYPCPLYSSSTKQELISTIALRTSQQPDHLDLIGVTLTL